MMPEDAKFALGTEGLRREATDGLSRLAPLSSLVTVILFGAGNAI